MDKNKLKKHAAAYLTMFLCYFFLTFNREKHRCFPGDRQNKIAKMGQWGCCQNPAETSIVIAPPHLTTCFDHPVCHILHDRECEPVVNPRRAPASWKYKDIQSQLWQLKVVIQRWYGWNRSPAPQQQPHAHTESSSLDSIIVIKLGWRSDPELP